MEIGNWVTTQDIEPRLKFATKFLRENKKLCKVGVLPLDNQPDFTAYLIRNEQGFNGKNFTDLRVLVVDKESNDPEQVVASFYLEDPKPPFKDQKRKVTTPHAVVKKSYQRMGITRSVYMALLKNMCLLSTGFQSKPANKLWHALARQGYPWVAVLLPVTARDQDDLNVILTDHSVPPGRTRGTFWWAPSEISKVKRTIRLHENMRILMAPTAEILEKLLDNIDAQSGSEEVRNIQKVKKYLKKKPRMVN